MGKTETKMKRKGQKSMRELSGNERRARRKKARHRVVIMQRIFVAVFVLAVAGGCFAIVWNLPILKLDRELKAGEEYTREASYDEAIEYYEKALKIDCESVKVYRCMANAYFGKEDALHAKQILLEGWQNTQDESLLQYYCTVILNEAVAEINNNSCSLETTQKILSVLEMDADNTDASELMHTAYKRIIGNLVESNNTSLFYDNNEGEESCAFALYEQIMNKLFEIYRTNPSKEVKDIIFQYAVIDIPELKMSRQHLEAYRKILEEADTLGEDESRSDLLSCLNKEAEIQAIFADIFEEFDAGNYEAAKEFIVSDDYINIRDAFINGTMEYWNGATYIPINRETVILKQTEKKWTFEFPEFKEEDDTAGIITVCGNKMTDYGVQRCCIAYEPSEGTSGYFPHTEYVISYMYSNVMKKNSFEAEMNYHFETRTWTEEGMTTDMIGDWGGEYQWEKTY